MGTHRSTTVYNITYETPRGAVKHVLWRGKDEGNAERSWLAMAAPGTIIISTHPHKITWIQ